MPREAGLFEMAGGRPLNPLGRYVATLLATHQVAPQRTYCITPHTTEKDRPGSTKGID